MSHAHSHKDVALVQMFSYESFITWISKPITLFRNFPFIVLTLEKKNFSFLLLVLPALTCASVEVPNNFHKNQYFECNLQMYLDLKYTFAVPWCPQARQWAMHTRQKAPFSLNAAVALWNVAIGNSFGQYDLAFLLLSTG